MAGEVIVTSQDGLYNALVKPENGEDIKHTKLNEQGIKQLLDIYVNQGYKITREDPEAMEDSPYEQNDYDRWAREAMAIPYRVKMHESKNMALIRRQNAISEKIAAIKREVIMAVYSEADAEGKKKFTNEKTRDTETETRLANNPEVQVLNEETNTLIEATKENQRELTFQKGLIRSIELVAELNKIKLRVE